MVVAMVTGVSASRTDEELMADVSARDMEAFETLYDRYGTLVYSTVLWVLRDVHLAEDTSQEVFLRLWRRSERYGPQRGRFVSWLLSVARNEAVDQVRSRGRHRRHEAGSEETERVVPTDDSEDPALMAELADERQRVRGALARLPAEQRKAIELAYFGGFTQQEIAELLSEPLGTVKTRIRLGMLKLRVFLAPQMQTVNVGSAS